MASIYYPVPLEGEWLKPAAPATDEELIGLAKDGDGAAFDELVKRHRTAVYATSIRIVEQVEDAEDVVQETFLAALVHLGGFRGESSFRTWITRLAVNESLTILRRRKRRALDLAEEIVEGHHDLALSETNPVKTPLEVLTEREARGRMERLIGRLTEPYRRTMRLWACESWTIAEISNELGISEGAVKTRLHRARTRLARFLPKPAGATKNLAGAAEN